MDRELEYLERVRRDILTHIQAFPNDSFGHKKLAHCDQEIAKLTEVPIMGHMAKRLAPTPCVWHRDQGEEIAATRKHTRQEHEMPRVAEPAKPKPAAPELRYTFGADYEQDQLWLAAERKKVNPLGLGDWPSNTAITDPGEPDKMMFPTMAYNLTSMHNLNYGVSRY